MDDGGYDISTLLQQLDIAEESHPPHVESKQPKSPDQHNGQPPQAQPNSPGTSPQRGPPLTHQTLAAHQQGLATAPQPPSWQSSSSQMTNSQATMQTHIATQPPSAPASSAPATEYQTVYYNGQLFQVPYGMALAQVSANGQIEQIPQQVVHPAQYAVSQGAAKAPTSVQQTFAQAPPYHFGSLPQVQYQAVGGQPQVVTVAPYQTQMTPQLSAQPQGVQQRYVPQVVQFGPNGQVTQVGGQMPQVVMSADQYQLALQQQQQQFAGFRGAVAAAPMVQYQQLSAPQYQAVTQALQTGQQPVMITVPPGMTPEQCLAQLQSNGLKGQIMQYNAQGQIHPATFPFQTQAHVPQQSPQANRPQPQPQQQQLPQPQVSQAATQRPVSTPQAPAAQSAVASRYPTQPVHSPTAAARGEGTEDLTKLNPKAPPFVPKVAAQPQPVTQPVAQPTPPAPTTAIPRSKESTITCVHCNETGFLTEYVLRSHIKAKHSAESQVAPPGTDHANKAVVHLNNIIRQYLTNECGSGSVAFDHLNRYLEVTHAVALGEALQVAKSFAEVLAQGNFRRFAYTADELMRAEIRPEIARMGEARVALPNVDYISSDTARSKPFVLPS